MADEAEHIGQDEIEQLLKEARAAAAPPSDTPAAAGQAPPASDPKDLGQAEIDALLGGAGGSAAQANAAAGATATQSVASAPSAAGAQDAGAKSSVTGDDIQLLLDQAEQAIASVDEPAAAGVQGMEPFRFEDFSGAAASSDKASLELLRDVELDLKIELGRTHMHLEEVLKLRKGSVVALDKLAGDPVDVYVNGRLIARGEVLVFNDSFCVRVGELIAGDDTG